MTAIRPARRPLDAQSGVDHHAHEEEPVRERPAGRGPSLATVVGAVVVVFGGLLVGLGPLNDNSFLTHLATGELILDGGIPRHDPYSFTAAGEPWVVQSWLASTIYAWLDRAFGGDAIVLLVAMCAVALAWGVWIMTRPAGSLIPRLVLAVLVVAGGGGYLVERPLLFGLLALTLALLVADGHARAVWLLPVGWAWVNTHGSFPLGLLALAVLALGRRLDGDRPDAELRALRWLAGGIAIGALNPLGPRLLLFPFQSLGRSDQLRAILEWQAPNFTGLFERIFLLVIVLAIVAIARRPSWRAALPLVVFVAAALISARNVPVASLVLVPGAARGLAGLGSISGDERRPVLRVALATVVAAAALLVAGTLRDGPYEFGAYPVAAVNWLDERGLGDGALRLATQDFVGNYLEARYLGAVPTFIDDRFDMFPAAVIDDYLVLVGGSEGWDDVLDVHGVDAVLWDSELPLAQLLDATPAWTVVYERGGWIVACRDGVREPACG